MWADKVERLNKTEEAMSLEGGATWLQPEATKYLTRGKNQLLKCYGMKQLKDWTPLCCHMWDCMGGKTPSSTSIECELRDIQSEKIRKLPSPCIHTFGAERQITGLRVKELEDWTVPTLMARKSCKHRTWYPQSNRRTAGQMLSGWFLLKNQLRQSSSD